MTPVSRIVLHADDLGMSRSVNRGIISGFSHGLLTSASILSNGPEFDDAVSRWQALEHTRAAAGLPSADSRVVLGDHGDSPFDLGVHLNLTEGMPLMPGFPDECLDAEGRFAGICRVLRKLTVAPGRFRAAIVDELAAQIARVVDAGLRPTHLNGHHYVELIPALAEPIRALAARFQIPAVRAAREHNVWLALRNHPSPAVNTCLTLVKAGLAGRLRHQVHGHLSLADAFVGTAHAGRLSLDLLRRAVSDLRPGSTMEVGLHPGESPSAGSLPATADGWHDSIAHLRPSDLALVQSPQLIEVLATEKLQLGRIVWLPGPARVAS